MSNRAMRTVLVGVSAALLVTACQKGAGTGGGKIEGAAASALDRLPKETGLVVGFSAARFRDTKLFGMLQGNLPEESKKVLDEVKQTCQLDFLNDLDSVIVASGGNMDKDRTLMLIKGKWDEDKVGKCAAAEGAKHTKVTVTKDGPITTYSVEGENPVHVAWSGDTALVTPAAMQGDKTYLSDLLKQKGTVKDNAAFMDILGKCDTGATFFAAILPPENSEMTNTMSKMTGGNEKLKAGWISVRLGKDLDAFGGMRFATDAEAKTVADKMNQELETGRTDPSAGEYLKSLTVTPQGPDVTFKMTLTEKQVDQLTDMAKQMIPMLGMMLGGGR